VLTEIIPKGELGIRQRRHRTSGLNASGRAPTSTS
jgi:hypothetical protein